MQLRLLIQQFSLRYKLSAQNDGRTPLMRCRYHAWAKPLQNFCLHVKIIIFDRITCLLDQIMRILDRIMCMFDHISIYNNTIKPRLFEEKPVEKCRVVPDYFYIFHSNNFSSWPIHLLHDKMLIIQNLDVRPYRDYYHILGKPLKNVLMLIHVLSLETNTLVQIVFDLTGNQTTRHSLLLKLWFYPKVLPLFRPKSSQNDQNMTDSILCLSLIHI